MRSAQVSLVRIGLAGLLSGCALETSGLLGPDATGTVGGGDTADGGTTLAPGVTQDAGVAHDAGAATPKGTSDSGADAEGAVTSADASTPPASLQPPDDAAAAPPPLVGAWNIDGPTYVGIDFPGTWIAAPVPGICAGTTYEATSALHGTNDAPLFEGEAFGNPATCTVGSNLASGTYRVSLLFAEIYWGDGCPGGGGVGSRVFDVVIEGTTLLADFDILAASGGCLASTTSDAGVPIVRTFDVPVTDGTIDIELPASKDNGKISALEVSGPL